MLYTNHSFPLTPLLNVTIDFFTKKRLLNVKDYQLKRIFENNRRIKSLSVLQHKINGR